MGRPTVVVARHGEDVGWIEALRCDKFVVQKGVHLPNVGRESMSYAWYIIQNYQRLQGSYFFLQANPFDHDALIEFSDTRSRAFGALRRTEADGSPDHPGLPILWFAERLGLRADLPCWFFGNGQFCVQAHEIAAHPLAFYQKIYRMHQDHQETPYVLERLWRWIYPALSPGLPA